MLRLLFVVGAWLVARALGVSEKIALHQVNTSALLYPNGTLDYAKVKSQIRHIQHRHCLAQQKHHSCRRMFPSLYKRYHSQEAMEQSGLAGAPTIPVNIGNQALMLMFDTTAMHTLIEPARYISGRSPSAVYLGPRYFTLSPSDRVSEAACWRDIMSIARLSVQSTFFQGQHHILDPSSTAADGVVSFSRHHLLSQNPAPPIYEMHQDLLLDRPLFAFSLPHAARRLLTDGVLTLGAIDRNAFTGSLRYSPVEWQARYQNFWAVRGKLNGRERVMIFDTGSPFIILPIQLARAVFEEQYVQSLLSQGVLFGRYFCRRDPSIRIQIGRASVPIHPISLQVGDEDNGWCDLSVVGAEQEDITLGRPFFENAYTVMDLTGRVGLSKI
ncbi:hypothetical protein V8E36_007532 [Tilletia maclaganii]